MKENPGRPGGNLEIVKRRFFYTSKGSETASYRISRAPNYIFISCFCSLSPGKSLLLYSTVCQGENEASSLTETCARENPRLPLLPLLINCRIQRQILPDQPRRRLNRRYNPPEVLCQKIQQSQQWPSQHYHWSRSECRHKSRVSGWK